MSLYFFSNVKFVELSKVPLTLSCAYFLSIYLSFFLFPDSALCPSGKNVAAALLQTQTDSETPAHIRASREKIAKATKLF